VEPTKPDNTWRERLIGVGLVAFVLFCLAMSMAGFL
jgi:hypothetical protein